MAKTKITASQLPDVIKSILEEYADDITRNIPEITERIGKEGVKAVKTEARQKFKTQKKKPYRYAKGWRSYTEHQRMKTTVIIYNASVPGLPHLLEHGHAKRNGGRVPGKLHIEPVEKNLIEKYEKVIENELQGNS